MLRTAREPGGPLASTRPECTRLALGELVFLGVALLVVGCSGCTDDSDVALRSDVAALREVMVDDPAQQPLVEVERVARDRPVLAGRLLRSGAIPAAQRQVRTLEQVRLQTERGRQLAARLVSAYRARESALQEYAEVLAAGASDDDALLEALRGQSSAERLLLGIDSEMEVILSSAPAAGERR